MRPNYPTFCLALAIAGCAPNQPSSSTLEAEAAPTISGQRRDVVSVTAAMSAVDGATSQACPSDDFGKFLRAFSDSASVQRQFTKLPLEHGHLDTAAIGTER